LERIILFLLLIGLGLFYLITNGYIDLSHFNIEKIDSNSLILIAMGVIILFLLFSSKRGNSDSHGNSRGGRRGGGRGRRGH